MKEIWKDIKNYEGHYQISNFGNVKSLKSDVILCKRKNKDNYLEARLFKYGKAKQYLIHRLVAGAFIINSDNKPQVNHIDGDKSNNTVGNLEWVTNDENTYHAFKIGLIKEGQLPRKVNQYNRSGVKIGSFDSLRKAEKNTGVSHESISYSCRNASRTVCAGGYIWRYD